MIGTIINAGAIVGAGLLGMLFRKSIPENAGRTMQDGLGLLVLTIGLQYAFKAQSLAVIGISLAMGAWFGEWRQWEAGLENLGQRLERLAGGGDSQFTKAFVSASLVFCVGAMAVMGSLQDGLTHNHDILLIKSILDGIFSLILSASMGVGVLFSALPVLLYQGSITLGAEFIKPLLTDPILNNINALGGILIAGIGTNLLGLTRIRVANLLPGLLFIPIIMALSKYLPW